MDRPLGLLAELTYACPLHCPYCSNPLNLGDYQEELTTQQWLRVIAEAAELGVLQLHLSGGEPLLRRDLVDIVRFASGQGMYTNLITSASGLSSRRAELLRAAGLDHVQISIQADEQALSDRIAGMPSFERKLAAARLVKKLGWPLTLNVVLHRHNIDRLGHILDLAAEIGADRLELANTQYYGWAQRNREALLPSQAQLERAETMVRAARERLQGQMEMIYVIPDYYSKYPKPCMGGWGRQQLTVVPNGDVLPCPTAHTLPLPRASVREHSLTWIWQQSPLFQRFRGTDWMPEPCRSCARRDLDFGGCRCQAFQLTGDAARTDPVCHLSPDHGIVASVVRAASEMASPREAALIPRPHPDIRRKELSGGTRVAVDNAGPSEQGAVPGAAGPAVLDPQHDGDIVGALGTLRQCQTGNTRSWRRKLRLLLVIIGPGLIVMGGGNDAGAVQVYAQMGQDYGMKLLWTLILLFPILYICQEMVVRLGAVSRVGHGRLIFARFGKFWGTFSVADLFVINAVTIVIEFIGVEQSLSFFRVPHVWAVVLSALLLFAVMAGGTYRYWERFLIALVIANFVTFPLVYLTHTNVTSAVSGAVPGLPGGVNASILLLVVAVAGTTIEPWQLFFQQSNVVDKRITSRWMNYERLDTGLGVIVEVIGAIVLMAACAFGLAHTKAFGNFADLSSTATALEHYVGHGAGGLLALATLDGSLIGANLTALTIGYTLGDVSGKMRHSLHWTPRQAPFFYGLYGGLVGLSAIVTLAWGNDLGVVVDGVEALNGILLPSSLVFLVLLANDKAVLGPWTNSPAQNWGSVVLVWAVTTFSLAPLVTTFFPNVTLTQCLYAFIVCTAGGLAAGAILWRLRPGRQQPVSMAPDGNQRPHGMSRYEWRVVLRTRRAEWRTPQLDTLPRPVFSVSRKIGLLTLRGYMFFAIVIMAIKLAQVAAH